MLNEFLKSVVVQSFSATDGGSNGPVVFTSTGDKFTFTAAVPIRLLKWGFIVDKVAVAQTASAMKFTLYTIPASAAGGGSGGGTAVDTLTTTATSGFALGTGGYRDPWTTSTTATSPPSEGTQAGPIGNTANTITSGQQQLTLSVGQQFVINVTTASDNTGQGRVWIEYVLLPITKPSGYGVTQAGTVSLTENYTRFSS